MTLLLTISPKVLAAEPHENPALAKPAFSGISLLRYYTDALDFVLRKNPDEVKARLEKMPFANIPESLEESAGNFTTSSIEISQLVVTIDENIGSVDGLIGQSRFREATKLAAETFSRLSQAYAELDRVEQAAETTGVELEVLSAPENSALRQAYDDLLEMIDRIRQLLDLYKKLLLSSFLTFGASGNATSVEEAAKLTAQLTTVIDNLKEAGISPEIIRQLQAIIEMLKKGVLSSEEAAKLAEQLAALVEKLTGAGVSQELLSILLTRQLLPTDITLDVEPTVAFVGDNINFEGLLTSGGKPLAQRKVDILLDSSRYVTIETDAYGGFQGTVKIPYRYVPVIDLQALYYPQEEDIGVYLAALSPVVNLKVLFYETKLEVTLADKAYLGLETTVIGRVDYGQSPSLNERRVEVYLDDVLISDTIEQNTFSKKIRIDPQAELGEHSVTVSAVPVERYASVVAGATLNITQAVPILDMRLPTLALMPGRVGLTGKLRSELGPLDKASIKMGLGKSQVEVTSSENGAFDTRIGAGMGLGLIGSQDLVIQVIPKEPWNAIIVTSRSLVMVNWVNCGGILTILVFLGLYLPRRLQGRFGVYLRKREKQIVAVAQPESTPVYSQVLVTSVHAEERGEIYLEPRDRIFDWYRLVVRLIQVVTKALLGPQQTLREFAGASRNVLGPAAKYFIELTMMVEKMLYSRYTPTEEDAEKSKELSNDVEEGLKGEGI